MRGRCWNGRRWMRILVNRSSMKSARTDPPMQSRHANHPPTKQISTKKIKTLSRPIDLLRIWTEGDANDAYSYVYSYKQITDWYTMLCVYPHPTLPHPAQQTKKLSNTLCTAASISIHCLPATIEAVISLVSITAANIPAPKIPPSAFSSNTTRL